MQCICIIIPSIIKLVPPSVLFPNDGTNVRIYCATIVHNKKDLYFLQSKFFKKAVELCACLRKISFD